MKLSKDKAVGVGFFATALIATAWTTASIFSPRPYDQVLDFTGDYATAPMREALSPDSVDRYQADIEALGSRMLGQEGLDQTANFIADEYSAHGLDLFRLDGNVAAPVTRHRSIQLANGMAMPGVEIYPFPPNAFQPSVTPADGLTGTLISLDDNSLLERADFTDVIGVIRLDQVLRIQGLEWTRYAQLGLKGLILVHPEGMDAISWAELLAHSGMQSILPVNFLLVAASEGLLD